jgi:hypothetical protein
VLIRFFGYQKNKPTFTRFRRFGGEDRAFERLEQRQIAGTVRKGRSKPAIDVNLHWLVRCPGFRRSARLALIQINYQSETVLLFQNCAPFPTAFSAASVLARARLRSAGHESGGLTWINVPCPDSGSHEFGSRYPSQG